MGGQGKCSWGRRDPRGHGDVEKQKGGTPGLVNKREKGLQLGCERAILKHECKGQITRPMKGSGRGSFPRTSRNEAGKEGVASLRNTL